MADPRLKQLKIKTGVVKRLTKEKCSYEKEAQSQKAKVDKMTAEKADEYILKKQNEVLQETRAMIPDCLRRLQTALVELKNILDSETDLNENEDYKSAVSVAEVAQQEIENTSK